MGIVYLTAMKRLLVNQEDLHPNTPTNTSLTLGSPHEPGFARFVLPEIRKKEESCEKGLYEGN